jgi:phosphatidylinositol 3-kinase
MKVVKERKQVSGKYEKMNVLDAFKDIKIKEKEALEKKQKTYSIMLKNGDDVRQDQLIMQLIKIMDDKLKTINMDLELVPYGILSTAAESGLLEFITAKDGSRSWTMSEVLATHNNSVLDFLRRYNPDASTDNKVSAQCMSTFVRSCAGYAVVTFLLGIGDRHLDNVMMLQDGHFVHIDFGWIFGEDPKKKFVKPPPFRFHKSLLDAMSGKTGAYFQEFCNKAKAAYLHLRRHASLLLSLCRLMVDAGIEAFVLVGQRGGDPEDLLKVMLDRFRLEENDEIAGMYFDDIISESVNHRGVEALESFHKIAVSLR